MDTADTSKGKRNDTATPQDTTSVGKISGISNVTQVISQKVLKKEAYSNF